jgi:hypothetical protein
LGRLLVLARLIKVPLGRGGGQWWVFVEGLRVEAWEAMDELASDGLVERGECWTE